MRAPFLLVAAVALGAVLLALPGCDTASVQPSEPVQLRVTTLNLDRESPLAAIEFDGS
ncbi:MAG: hypothetical protein AAGI52_14335 [Bacteroidota bacterium]